MKHVNCKINGIADALTLGHPMAKADHGSTIRICDVPDEIPIGEALREADRIAFWHANTTSCHRPRTVAWDRIKGAPTGTIIR
jgi:hypothetical protein